MTTLSKGIAALRSGQDAPHAAEEANGIGRAEESIMLGLRLREGVEWRVIEAGFDAGRAARIRACASRLAAGGFLEDDGVRVRLADEGLFVSNALIAELLDS